MTHLKEGDKAPDFSGIDTNGSKISLSDFKGKKLILYFYPKDDTSGCTKEACNFRDSIKEIKNLGAEILGVSNDTIESHQKFTKKYLLPFSLIADVEKKIVQAYGVYGEKRFMDNKYMGITRSTFIIDEKGIIKKIFYKVKVDGHLEEVAETLKI